MQFHKFSKSIEQLSKSRQVLISTTEELANSLRNLSKIELDRLLGEDFQQLANIHDRILEIYKRQNQQDLYTLGSSAEEATRLVGSVRKAFAMREKIWFFWQAAETELEKHQVSLEKICKHGRTQQEKISHTKELVEATQHRCATYKSEFEMVSNRLKGELKQFNLDRINSLKANIEVGLEGQIETQKEVYDK